MRRPVEVDRPHSVFTTREELALLYEPDEGNHSSARADHDSRHNSVSQRHVEPRGLHEHIDISLRIWLLEQVLQELRCQSVLACFSILSETNSDSNELRMS